MQTKPHIQVILGTTREGRHSDVVGEWLSHHLDARDDFTFEIVDLKEWNLPFFNDPNHPAMGRYSDPRVREFAAKIAKADGYVVVTAEYNHGYPAVLKNAFDSIAPEWYRKAVAFVSYGGFVGAGRAVEQLRQVVAELRMVDTRDTLHILHAMKHWDNPSTLAEYDEQVTPVIDDLLWWTNATKTAREHQLAAA